MVSPPEKILKDHLLAKVHLLAKEHQLAKVHQVANISPYQGLVWANLQKRSPNRRRNGTSKVDTEKKRNASKANLSPQDKNLLAKSKNLKTK